MIRSHALSQAHDPPPDVKHSGNILCPQKKHCHDNEAASCWSMMYSDTRATTSVTEAAPVVANKKYDRLVATPCGGSQTSHMQNRSAKHTAARDCRAVADLREAAPLQCARKRLRCKTTVEHVGAALPLSQVNSVGGSVIKFDWKTRRHAEQQYAADWMRRHKCSSGTYWSRRDAGRAAFRSLSEDKQQPWIDDAV